MSIDDGLGRDPRLDHLAELCGWSRRETAGCLQLEIWPLCYDRVTPNITARDINTAAAREAVSPILHVDGFAGALIEAGLARPSRRTDASFEWVRKGKPTLVLHWHDREWKGRVYIKGAAERIAYLIKSEESGRIGGRNSGGTRGKGSKGPLSDPSRDPQGSGNPIPTATDTVTPTATATATASASAESPLPPKPPASGFTDRKQKLEWLAWNLAETEHRSLRAGGIDPNAIDWPRLPLGDGAKELGKRIAELLDADADKAEARLRHVVAVRVAEVKRTRSLRYFTPSTMWASLPFWKAAEMSVEHASAGPPEKPPKGRSGDDSIRTIDQL